MPHWEWTLWRPPSGLSFMIYGSDSAHVGKGTPGELNPDSYSQVHRDYFASAKRVRDLHSLSVTPFLYSVRPW